MCEIDPHDGKGPPRLQVSDLSRRSFAALSFFAGVAAASPLRAPRRCGHGESGGDQDTDGVADASFAHPTKGKLSGRSSSGPMPWACGPASAPWRVNTRAWIFGAGAQSLTIARSGRRISTSRPFNFGDKPTMDKLYRLIGEFPTAGAMRVPSPTSNSSTSSHRG